ncbi:hypothetical protein [Bradyrhizobium ivorense]|nr:hypothetical protein [Bradyrhizobium ivorense]
MLTLTARELRQHVERGYFPRAYTVQAFDSIALTSSTFRGGIDE